mmetsp:Transcript_814/g.1918  ORF Transcript_814/g.1918 Transcript_814/m.1918 type:complete len:193 (+) Transcript_814:956-1534(+)
MLDACCRMLQQGSRAQQGQVRVGEDPEHSGLRRWCSAQVRCSRSRWPCCILSGTRALCRAVPGVLDWTRERCHVGRGCMLLSSRLSATDTDTQTQTTVVMQMPWLCEHAEHRCEKPHLPSQTLARCSPSLRHSRLGSLTHVGHEVSYCGNACETAHRKAHKQECKRTQARSAGRGSAHGLEGPAESVGLNLA